MFKRALFIGLSGALVIGASIPAFAADVRELPKAGELSVSPYAGTGFSVGGNFVKGASETATLTFSDGSTITAGITAKDKDFLDVFSPPIVLGIGANYGLSNEAEVFGNIRYAHAIADRFTAATVDVAGNFLGVAIGASVDITGEFDDYNEIGAEVGYRQFFKAGDGFRPYVSGSVGFKRVSSIDIKLSAVGSSLAGIKFTNSAITYTAGLGVGLRYDIDQSSVIGIETGLRYSGKLNDDDTDFGTAGNFSVVNDDGDNLEIPISVRAVFAF